VRGVCQAQRSLDRRDESRNAIEGGAARMAQVSVMSPSHTHIYALSLTHSLFLSFSHFPSLFEKWCAAPCAACYCHDPDCADIFAVGAGA